MKSYALKLIIFKLLKVMNVEKSRIMKKKKDGAPPSPFDVQYYTQLQQALKFLRQANNMNVSDENIKAKDEVTDVD